MATRFVRAFLGRVFTDEDAVAAAIHEVHREGVVARDHDVTRGHDQQHREQAGDREGVAAQSSPAGSAVARGGLGVHEFGDAIASTIATTR